MFLIFTGKELYEQLKKYILTEEQLRENGYPRPGEDGSNKVRFFKEEEKDKMLKGEYKEMWNISSYNFTCYFTQ